MASLEGGKFYTIDLLIHYIKMQDFRQIKQLIEINSHLLTTPINDPHNYTANSNDTSDLIMHHILRNYDQFTTNQESLVKIINLLIPEGRQEAETIKKINIQGRGGDTLLHIAYKRGLNQLADYLLSEGIDKNIQNDNGLKAGESKDNDNDIDILSSVINLFETIKEARKFASKKQIALVSMSAMAIGFSVCSVYAASYNDMFDQRIEKAIRIIVPGIVGAIYVSHRVLEQFVKIKQPTEQIETNNYTTTRGISQQINGRSNSIIIDNTDNMTGSISLNIIDRKNQLNRTESASSINFADRLRGSTDGRRSSTDNIQINRDRSASSSNNFVEKYMLSKQNSNKGLEGASL
ncbi:MAG: ankyrin repeat domain-containing protein [Rickettsiales bacterium]|nr:MAG: ankyrin repeat domain-containing protein [Rickettsiales bacterium]